MDYQGVIYRPPSEANSILLQVSVGCSHNRCAFCGMYKDKRFRIKPWPLIQADIHEAALLFPQTRRLFLCDGDALILPQELLLRILGEIKTTLPAVERVGVYANAQCLRRKNVTQLQALRRLGLGIVYMGLESGDDETLHAINKGATAAELIALGLKARQAGIALSVTVLLGIAGPERSLIHAKATGQALSAIDPEYIGALSLMLEADTPLAKAVHTGEFTLPTAQQMVLELRAMIEATTLSNGLFHANHASNYVPIRARLPQEKADTLRLLDDALDGQRALKPEYLRAL